MLFGLFLKPYLMLPDFFKWLSENPTPTITIISVIIALLALRHQRTEARKKNTYQVAENYTERIIPSAKYIKRIFDLVGITEYNKKFVNYQLFTRSEIEAYFKECGFTEQQYTEKLYQIEDKTLDEAFIFCGCHQSMEKYHKSFKEVEMNNAHLIGSAINNYIIYLLNDLEKISILFYNDIANEKLIYELLHDSFFQIIDILYYFIATNDNYSNIIWLYNEWKKRATI